MNEASQRRQAIEPAEISQESAKKLRIKWADGLVCEYNAATLRRACPCAQCLDEWTGERRLQPQMISDDVEMSDLSIVGRYALNFRWSDGHETGIYSFDYLRNFCDRIESREAIATG